MNAITLLFIISAILIIAVVVLVVKIAAVEGRINRIAWRIDEAKELVLKSENSNHVDMIAEEVCAIKDHLNIDAVYVKKHVEMRSKTK